MSTWVWIVIAVVVVAVVLGVIWAALRSRRTRGLQERFGSEYDRVAADAPSRRQAESELQERERRHEEFDIRPLSPEQRDNYQAQWQSIQADFVDDPSGSLAEADSLIQTVMRERGYPVDDSRRAPATCRSTIRTSSRTTARVTASRSRTSAARPAPRSYARPCSTTGRSSRSLWSSRRATRRAADARAR